MPGRKLQRATSFLHYFSKRRKPYRIVLDHTLPNFLVDRHKMFGEPYLKVLNCFWDICINTVFKKKPTKIKTVSSNQGQIGRAHV